jgi:hypothetical protein
MPTPVAHPLYRAEEGKDTQRGPKLREFPGRNPPEHTTTYTTKNLPISTYRSTGNLEPAHRRFILDGVPSPRFTDIVVDIAKLRDYCLNESHPRGRHKARVFRARLGLTSAEAEFLRQGLLAAAKIGLDRLRPSLADEFGHRFVLDFVITTKVGQGTIRSAWIVLNGQDVLKLSTC